jgi:hypothetical protein
MFIMIRGKIDTIEQVEDTDIHPDSIKYKCNWDKNETMIMKRVTKEIISERKVIVSLVTESFGEAKEAAMNYLKACITMARRNIRIADRSILQANTDMLAISKLKIPE